MRAADWTVMDQLALMFVILFAVLLADPEAADADARLQAERDARMAATIERIRAEVVEAGRREAPAARREPGMPPDPVDRVTRRLDLGSTR